MAELMDSECCRDDEQPCAACRKAIHQSWHQQGLWWIRQEECDESCPCWIDTVERRTSGTVPERAIRY